jgi:hypothetical protein
MATPTTPVNVKKMLIRAYSDSKLQKEVKKMEVQINPESYSHKTEVKYDSKQAFGTTGKQLKFNKIEPQKMEFEFLFDSTGLVNGVKDTTNGVEVQLQKLRDVLISYDGNSHRPRYLRIVWGTLMFNCCIDTLDITYKLFNKDGAPLRATARAAFTGFKEENRRLAEEKSKSADLTHVRMIREGETLPLICHEIYGDPKYYIEVAKINNLKNFRKLNVGDKLIFPPISK